MKIEYNNNQSIESLWRNFTDAELRDGRSLFVSEAVTSDTASKVISSLLVLDARSQDPITIYLNSPGGEVNSGFAIYDTIRYLSSEVFIINTGLCASIATIINVSVKKANRLSMLNARFLIHQPHIPSQITGPASDIEITATEIVKTRSKLNQILSEECGQPLSKIEEDTQRDYWMSATEALEYGLITKIVKNKNDLPSALT